MTPRWCLQITARSKESYTKHPRSRRRSRQTKDNANINVRLYVCLYMYVLCVHCAKSDGVAAGTVNSLRGLHCPRSVSCTTGAPGKGCLGTCLICSHSKARRITVRGGQRKPKSNYYHRRGWSACACCYFAKQTRANIRQKCIAVNNNECYI